MNDPGAKSSPVLLFDWQPPRGEKVAIAAFLAGSAILHALGFYLFQIVYPPAVALLLPRARVSLIAPNSEEGRTILRWVDAEDPALTSATQRPPGAKVFILPRVQHVPSYLLEQPRLKQPPPLKFEARAPSSFPPGPVPMPRPAMAPAAPSPTHLLLSDDLTKLGKLSSPPARFTASTRESPESVRFRIAVEPSGTIDYCFRLNSSGDPALDEQARHYLLLSRFPGRLPMAGGGNDGLLTWGIATVEWGNDVAPPPSNTPAPSP
jgi:hypothetical protein